MQRRDIELIARVIRANSCGQFRRKLAEAFALELGQIVSAFDRAKFFKACGVKEVKS